MRCGPVVIKICNGQSAGAVGAVLSRGPAQTRWNRRKPGRCRAADPGPPGCPGSARLVWFRPGCPAARPAAARPASVDLAEALLAVNSSSPTPAPLRPTRLSLLPARPPGRPCRSCRGAACRGQQLTNPSATPTRPGCPCCPAVRPPDRPAVRPALGLSVSILERWCLPRTAANQPRRHPDPPGCPCCPPGRPTGRRPARERRSCRSAASREQQLTNPSTTPTPPAETQGKYPDNNRGRRPDDGHHAQKPGTPPTIRKPTHQPGNTATMRDTRPGRNHPAGNHRPTIRHTTGHTQTRHN